MQTANMHLAIRHLVALAALTLFAWGCTASRYTLDLDAERANLLETDRAFSRLSEAQGVPAAFSAYLAPEAVYFPMQLAPVEGHDAIVELLAGVSDVTLTWEPQHAEVAGSGDLGVTWGLYRAEQQGPVATDPFAYGKYLTVWKKQNDGSWKAIFDIGNPGPAPGE